MGKITELKGKRAALDDLWDQVLERVRCICVEPGCQSPQEHAEMCPFGRAQAVFRDYEGILNAAQGKLHWTHEEVECGSGYGKYMGTGIYYKGHFMFEVTGHLSAEHVKQFGGFDGLADKVCRALNEADSNSKQEDKR